MADLATELANLNAQATELLAKYNGAFEKLDEETQNKIIELQNKAAELQAQIESLGFKFDENGILVKEDGSEISVGNALKLGGKSWEELAPVGTILEFMLIENGKKIRYANDPIDPRASSKGFELFCPHSKDEYEMARKYLISIGKPKAMGPLGIYKPSDGASSENKPLNSAFMGLDGWRVQDGSVTWWASDRTDVTEPNGDYTAYAYLGIQYDDNGYVTWWNDCNSNYVYSTYLCVRRKK